MAKARLLHAVCSVALLAAVPAFAQSNNPPGQTGAAGMPQGQAPSGTATPADNGSSASGNGNGMSENSSAQTMPMHRHHQAMMHHRMMKSSRSGRSQDAAVDQLNDQSLHAAQQGQTFDVAGSNGGGMSSNGMSSGSMGSGSMGSGSMGSGSMGSGSTGTGAATSGPSGATTGASQGGTATK